MISSVMLSNLSGRKNLRAVIRRDLKAPNRIYCEFPPFVSLTHDEAIALANQLVDVMEDIRRD